MVEVDLQNILIFNKYRTGHKLGQGSFGVVYSGTDIQTNAIVAIKFESRETGLNLLETEAYNMAYLKGDGVPQLICYGYNSKFNILIMEVLGENLEILFNKHKRQFSLKTVLHLAIQMLERVRNCHEKHFIHRDLKPENFLIGLSENEDHIYLIDFGLCYKYRSSKTKEHVGMSMGKSMTGTARYASKNSHLGYEQSRRDDLESLGYILIYFLKSTLPWMGVKAKKLEEKFRIIKEMKENVNFNELCIDLPYEFIEYMNYCRNLEFTDNPDYDYLISLFHNVMEKESLDLNSIRFDWNKPVGTEEIEEDEMDGDSDALPSDNSENSNDDANVSIINPNDNAVNNNKSAVVVLNQSRDNSFNISQINAKITKNYTNKHSNWSMYKKKTTMASSKKFTKVSFKNIEILSQSPDGKHIREIIEIPELKLEPERMARKKNTNGCKCIIF